LTQFREFKTTSSVSNVNVFVSQKNTKHGKALTVPIKHNQYGSHFEVTSYVLETPSGNGLLFGVEEEMSRCLPADMMKEQQRAKFTKRVAFWNNFEKLRIPISFSV
jgi:hypothetical protein